MFKGLDYNFLEIEWRLAVSGSFTADGFGGQLGAGGSLTSYWTDDYIAAALGVHLQVGIQEGTGPDPEGTSYSVHVPAVALLDDVLNALTLSAETTFHFYGVKIYLENTAVFRMEWTSWAWKIEGATEQSGGAGGITCSMAATPSAVPVVGYPPHLESSAGISPSVYSGPVTFGTVFTPRDSQALSSVSGGYRYKTLDGTWVAPPVTLPPGMSHLSGSDAYAMACEAKHREVLTTNTVLRQQHQGNATAMPDPDKSVVRMDPDDYAALVFRWGMPGGARTDTARHTEQDATGEVIVDDITTGDTTLLAPLSQFLEEVEEAAGTLDASIGATCYAPCAFGESEDYGFIGGATHDSVSASYPTFIPQTGSMSLLSHAEDFIHYWNSRGNPHWAHQLFFPTEDGSFQWQIGGGDAKPQEYWLGARQQHLYHPSLPSDGSGRRNHILSEPLTNSALLGFMEGQVYGQWTSFWGVSNFHTQVPALEVYEATEDSAALYSCDEIDPLTVNSTGVVVASGGGPTEFTLEFDLGSFAVAPFQSPHLAREVLLGWSGATDVKVYLVGADGKKALISDDLPGWTAYLAAEGRKYGHTAQNDFGQGFIGDTAVESSMARSHAPAMAAYAESSFAPQLLAGRTAQLIQWVVTRDVGDTTTIEHPQFRGRDWDEWTVLPETPQHLTAICDDGPGVRLGTWSHWDYLFDVLSDPPTVHPQSGMPTVFDWLRSRRLIFEAKDADDGLSAEIATLYENGVEYTLDRHLARDAATLAPSTHVFFAPGASGAVACLVSSLREPPPLAMFPRKLRTAASDWEETGAFVCASYSHCPARRWHVAPEEVLLTDGGTDILTTETPPTGWFTRWHERVTDGTEGYDFRLETVDRWFAKVRPWRGFLLIPGQFVATLLALLARRDGRLFRLIGDEGTKFGASSVPSYGTWDDKDVYDEATDGALIRLTGEALAALLVVSDTVLLFKVEDEGNEAFTIMVTDGSGTAGALAAVGDGSVAVYRVDGGTLKVTFRSAVDLSIISGPTATNITGLADEDRIAVDDVSLEGNQPAFILLVNSGGTVAAYQSPDGITFT